MRRIATLPAALAALVLAATPVLGGGFPTRIDLADGWRPEGIAAGRGTTAFVGSLADGGIATVDLRTGVRNDEFVASATGPAVGLEYEAGADRLWVAGGPTGEVRAYDASTGELLETYSFQAGFVNDVVATSDAIYATDSFMPQLLVVPLGAGGALPDPGDAFTLEITGDFVYDPAQFNANGIVAFGGWLLVPQSWSGRLFAIDPETGVSVEVLPEGSVSSADGLELVGSTLYVVRNFANAVDAWSIRGGQVVFLDTITDDDDDLDIPTTIAFAAGRLWAVNARFSTAPGPDVAYWITQLPLR